MERFGELAKAKQAHPAFSSALKYYGAELNKRRHELLMSAGGSDALEWEGARIGRRRRGAHLAAHQGQLDRGRHQRGAAQRHRQTHSRIARSLTMTLLLTEEQEMLRDSARDFLRENAPVSQLRKLRDSHDPAGFSRPAVVALCRHGLHRHAGAREPTAVRGWAWSKPAC